MPNTHAVVNLMHCAAWDVDAYNIAGICASDVDNGTLLSVDNNTTSTKTAAGNVTGFQYTVTVPSADATGLWIAKTPVPGTFTGLDAHVYSDPRYFYNEAGQPISLAYLVPGVDVIEVTAAAFQAKNAPSDQPTYTYATVNTFGELVIAEAVGNGTTFALLGTHYIDCGQDIVTSYVLKCIKN